MKAKVIIFDSSYSFNKDEGNFITIITFKTPKDPSTITSMSNQGFEDDGNELIDSYNMLFKKHIKSKNTRKLAFESLEEKDKKLSALKATFEEIKSSTSYD